MKHLYKIQSKLFEFWNNSLPTAGQLSVASFFIAIISGVILALSYDVANPLQSLQILLISNSSASFFRSLHYWSGQLFLIFTIWHIYEHFFLGSEKEVSSGIWIRLVILIPFIFYIMLSGFILKGDSEAILAKQIFSGLIETVPFVGSEIRYMLLGIEKDFQIIYMHHVATSTIFVLLIIIEHTRRIWTNWISLVYVFSTLIILGFFFPAILHTDFEPIVKGPWYFLGLQEILHWTTYPALLMFFVVSILIVLTILPKISNQWQTSILKRGLFILCVLYFILSIVGWIFRGENWQFILPF